MAVLAQAHAREIEQGLRAVMDPLDYMELRPPEIGLVMLRGRIGGDGGAFNLGEATVTRAAVQIASGTGQRLPLSGPGIPGVRSFSAQPLPPDFPARIAANRALFPRGIDVVLVSANSVAALPRSVALQRG
jgi:phosphonate metabolism protein PhnG/phosphonate metabolism protein PhnH